MVVSGGAIWHIPAAHPPDERLTKKAGTLVEYRLGGFAPLAAERNRILRERLKLIRQAPAAPEPPRRVARSLRGRV